MKPLSLIFFLTLLNFSGFTQKLILDEIDRYLKYHSRETNSNALGVSGSTGTIAVAAKQMGVDEQLIFIIMTNKPFRPLKGSNVILVVENGIDIELNIVFSALFLVDLQKGYIQTFICELTEAQRALLRVKSITSLRVSDFEQQHLTMDIKLGNQQVISRCLALFK